MSRPPAVPPALTRGPFTLDEARRAGLTWDQLQGDSWRRIGRSMYVWAGIAESPFLALAAARRRLPQDAVFSGRTAVLLHGLGLAGCDPIEVTLPPGCRFGARFGLAVRRARLRSDEIVIRSGMPATSAVRTLFDLARVGPTIEAAVIAEAAVRSGLVTRSKLPPELAPLIEPRSESPMETRLRILLITAGLPAPEVQVPLYDDRGYLIARADLCYPAERLVIEYDGATHRDSLVEDDRRQNRITNAGYRVLRFSASDLLRSPEAVVAQVRVALAAPSGRFPP